jgi:hypothetical protein
MTSDETKWHRLYAGVLLTLAVEVALFYWFTRALS